MPDKGMEKNMQQTVFLKLCKENLDLVKKKQYRMDEDKGNELLENLAKDIKKGSSIQEILEIAEPLGLIAKSYGEKEYVFPLAKVIASLNQEGQMIAESFLNDFGNQDLYNNPIAPMVDNFIAEAFSFCPDRTVDMMEAREGLKTGKPKTLQAIGDKYEITRERVRQIEEKFWGEVWEKNNPSYPKFICAFLCQFMAEKGSLIVQRKRKDFQIHRFLCKACRVPFRNYEKFGFAVKVLSPKERNAIQDDTIRLNLMYTQKLAKEFDGRFKLPMKKEDIEFVSTEIVQYFRKHMIRAERLYLTFLSTGHPLHFTDIQRFHNKLFPERTCTERSIRSALNAPRYVNQFGFVWIGTRGTYGLKEWGYEKPTENLMDMVTRIVSEVYNAEKKPVHLDYIRQEILKIRRVVKPSSIIIAASCNPRLERLSNRMFVPKDISKKDLETVLKKFNLRKPGRR